MVDSVDDLREIGYRSAILAPLLQEADWYLIGSRTNGFADDLSDWDTVLFCRDDVTENGILPEDLDMLFGVQRPSVVPKPDLPFHVASRRVGAVDIEVMGPSARERRELVTLAEWAFLLRHAQPISNTAEIGPAYLAVVARRFADHAPALAVAAYEEFRRTRNEAVSTLPRQDDLAQSLTTAVCTASAAQFWLLATGKPHPTEKWLIGELRRMDDTDELVTAMERANDPRHGSADRFEALLEIWRLVDTHARKVDMDPHLFAGSPF